MQQGKPPSMSVRGRRINAAASAGPAKSTRGNAATTATKKPRGEKRKGRDTRRKQSRGVQKACLARSGFERPCEEPPKPPQAGAANDGTVMAKTDVKESDSSTERLKDDGSIKFEGTGTRAAAGREDDATAPADLSPITASETVKEEEEEEEEEEGMPKSEVGSAGGTSNKPRRSRRLGNGSSHDEAVTTLNGVERKPKPKSRPKLKAGKKGRVGDVGYKFRKRFHAGWFIGRVVQIRPRASESISRSFPLL